jgi:hypothetical protein
MDTKNSRGQCVVELALVALFLVLSFIVTLTEFEAVGKNSLPNVQLSKEMNK